MSNAQLSKIRKEQGLTQKEVADFLMVEQPTISKLENGEMKLDVETAIKLSSLYRVTLDYLVGITEDTKIIISKKDIDDLPEQRKNDILLSIIKMLQERK